MNKFSTSTKRVQSVQKSNTSPQRNHPRSSSTSLNRNTLNKTGIIISQIGFLIVMLTVFNLMARNSTAQLHQAHEMVENEYLYDNAFKIGLSILMVGGIVFLTGTQKLNIPFLNKENSLMLKKFQAMNFKKVFGSWRIVDLFGH